MPRRTRPPEAKRSEHWLRVMVRDYPDVLDAAIARATTHPNAYKQLAPYCGEVVCERVVDDGGIITAGGVSSSIDLGLYLVEKLAGTDARKRIAAQMDYPYRWDS